MPCKTVKRHISDKLWITDGFKKTILNRQKAFCHGNKPLYKRLRNQANRERKRLKLSYLDRKLEQLKANPNHKKCWDSIKALAGHSKKIQISTCPIDNEFR